MPRAFLIKKQFRFTSTPKTKKSQDSRTKLDTEDIKKCDIPNDWTPPRTPSAELVTSTPPLSVPTSCRNPLSSLVDPFKTNTWLRSITSPHGQSNIITIQQPDYYNRTELYSLLMTTLRNDINQHNTVEKNHISKKSALKEVPCHQCPDCNKSYSTLRGLSKHQKFYCVTQAQKLFNCKYCDKVYVSLGALKMHIYTHTLPCKCKLCGKAFSRPWLLQGHIRTHTGEKPFACQYCNRAFADRSNLRAHFQTHSDVKKYSCSSCSKTFSRMSLLVKHKDGNCCH